LPVKLMAAGYGQTRRDARRQRPRQTPRQPAGRCSTKGTTVTCFQTSSSAPARR
jgi:hypothetical protein